MYKVELATALTRKAVVGINRRQMYAVKYAVIPLYA